MRVLRKVAEGIDAADARNIVHGDLKPASLFLASDSGTGETVKIVDFGLATLAPQSGESADASRNKVGIRGTPAFILWPLSSSAASRPSRRAIVTHWGQSPTNF